MADEGETEEVNKRIRAKEDLVRKLKMVKLHRTKVLIHSPIKKELMLMVMVIAFIAQLCRTRQAHQRVAASISRSTR